ncbi:MAG: sulfite exporter TauE/SafE family protein [Bacteroidia bacterium]
MFFLVAISLGFLGSFHCVGMCGPIALAIPVKRISFFSVLSGSLVYNSGRAVTYSLMGLLFGLFGQGMAMAGWQNALSIILGLAMLILVFIPRFSFLKKRTGNIFRLMEKLKAQLKKLFGIHSTGSLFLIGILNGLLPCGLVYLGIAGAMATGMAWKGALFMAAFGLGTFPAMLLLTLAGNRISMNAREKIKRAVPVFVSIMALMLILRGMNLGIPYLSPSLEVKENICYHNCCKK